jgi:hypothetical protein
MQETDTYSDEEAKRRFEAALRGARLASPTPMKDFIGKSKRATTRAKSRVKKTAQSGPKSP